MLFRQLCLSKRLAIAKTKLGLFIYLFLPSNALKGFEQAKMAILRLIIAWSPVQIRAGPHFCAFFDF